ncbi:MAG: AEC family transporter [Chitinophagales bacterium]|nr:AEC family transporter [Chitinophagales bacterium]
MESFLFIGCFFLGMVLKKWKLLPEETPKYINQFVLWISLPAITLMKVPAIHFDGKMLGLIGSAWILFSGAILFFILLGKLFHWDKKTIIALTIVCGLGNTSFVGYPYLSATLGGNAITYAIFVDQPGSFFILSTFGVGLSMWAAHGNLPIQQILSKLLRFPPFITFLLALFLPEINDSNMLDFLGYAGKTMIPLALFSIGMQFSLKWSPQHTLKFASGLTYKLILGPALALLFLYIVYGKIDFPQQVALLETAMPPMITASVICTQQNLENELTQQLVTWGIPISLITLTLWRYICF